MTAKFGGVPIGYHPSPAAIANMRAAQTARQRARRELAKAAANGNGASVVAPSPVAPIASELVPDARLLTAEELEARQEELFFEAYRICGSIATAAKKVGLPMRVVNKRRQQSPDFAARLLETHEGFLDDCEADLATMGRTKNNAIALIARLRADRAPRYLDKLQVQQNVTVATAYEPDPAEMQQLLREMVFSLGPESRVALGLPPAGDIIEAESAV